MRRPGRSRPRREAVRAGGAADARCWGGTHSPRAMSVAISSRSCGRALVPALPLAAERNQEPRGLPGRRVPPRDPQIVAGAAPCGAAKDPADRGTRHQGRFCSQVCSASDASPAARPGVAAATWRSSSGGRDGMASHGRRLPLGAMSSDAADQALLRRGRPRRFGPALAATGAWDSTPSATRTLEGSAEVEAQRGLAPAAHALSAEVVGVAVHPPAAHPESARDIAHPDESVAFAGVVWRPLGPRSPRCPLRRASRSRPRGRRDRRTCESRCSTPSRRCGGEGSPPRPDASSGIRTRTLPRSVNGCKRIQAVLNGCKRTRCTAREAPLSGR